MNRPSDAFRGIRIPGGILPGVITVFACGYAYLLALFVLAAIQSASKPPMANVHCKASESLLGLYAPTECVTWSAVPDTGPLVNAPRFATPYSTFPIESFANVGPIMFAIVVGLVAYGVQRRLAVCSSGSLQQRKPAASDNNRRDE